MKGLRWWWHFRIHELIKIQLFLLIIITTCLIEDLSCADSSSSGKSIPFTGLIMDRPKIRVSSYRLQNLNPNRIMEEGVACGEGNNCDDLIKIGGGDEAKNRLGQDTDEIKEWSVPPNATQVTLQCSSKSGPIEWDYQGKGKFPQLEITSRRITGDFWSPTTYLHQSDITFNKISDQLTGTFVCRSVEKPSLSNSFYMFVPQERRPIFEKENVFILTPASRSSSVVIPCRVEDRESSIHLYKKMGDGSLKRMNMDSSLSMKFNPYVGFEVELSPEIYGHYVCKVDKKETNLKKKKIYGDEEDEKDESDARKVRVRRYAVQQVETSTSPGFSAFPTSEEIAAEYGMPLIDPEEVSITYSESEIERRNRLRRRGGKNKNGPVYLKRRRVSLGGGNNNQFSRRGGRPHPHHHPHGGGPYLRLRPKPLLGPFRRGPPPPNLQLHPHSSYNNRPSYHQQPPGMIRPAMIALPVSITVQNNESELNNVTLTPEKNGGTTTTISSSSTEQEDPQPSKDYFWPPLTPVLQQEHYDSIPPPVYPSASPLSQYQHLNRIKVIPSLINSVNKLGQRLRPTIRPFAPTSSEEMGELSSSENKEKQTEKDASLEEESSGQKKNKNKRRPGGGSGGGGGGAAGAILSPNFLPQTMNIMNSMGCVIKKVMLGPEASCNGTFLEAAAAANAALSRHPVRPGQMSLLGGEPEEQETILEVILLPRPADKFYPPESSTLYTRVPFFVKWQTRSTDYSNWAEVNHTLAPGTWKLHKAGHFDDYGIHSFEVFNLREGESGQISVPYVASDNKILVHTWKFVVINDTAFAEKGLSQREEGSKKIFSCKSATGTTKPKLTLTKLTDDGCPVDEGMSEKRRKGSKRKSLVEEDCGPGCVAIRTDIESGIVSCLGDGVDETLRYPADIYCTGRPFFVERGKTKNLTLSPNKKKFNIPCIINNPNADVYLFHQNPNGTISDVTDYTNYDLKLGFSLNLDEISDPLGTYACTSSTNVEDDTDMVTYHVNPAPPHVFNPPQETVYGSPPFRFVWESVEELEVENKSAGNFYSGVFAKPEGNRAFVGTFEIAALSKGASGVVNVIRAKDKVVVHTWRYAYQGKYGLWVDRKLNIFKCVSPTSKIPPSLFAVECSNPNACRLKKRFMEDDPEMHLQKDPENQYHHHHHHKKNKKHGHHRENNNFVTVPVECGEGCTELKVWNDKRHGFVECRDKVGQEEVNNNEMDESLTYFLTRNSTILTESDDLEPLRTIEISSVVRTLNVGDTITFVCRANAYFYSHGFQWAIEMKNGSKRFLDSSVSQETTTGADQRQLKAEVHLTVGGKDWKAVWCYAPSLTSNLWGNASQLVYIH